MKILEGKKILVVDDEPDILETVIDLFDSSHIVTAGSFEEAREKIAKESFDLVILDIMGVNGFELLKTSVKRGFPTVMLTAYALTPEALEKSIKLGAVSFLPKEKMSDLDEFLADVVLKGGQPQPRCQHWLRYQAKFRSRFQSRTSAPDSKGASPILAVQKTFRPI